MIVKSRHEIFKRRFGRNAALGGALAAFVILIFAVTMVKLSNGGMIQGY